MTRAKAASLEVFRSRQPFAHFSRVRDIFLRAGAKTAFFWRPSAPAEVKAGVKFLPEPLKKFVASQSLGPSQLKQLEECGYKVPTETSSTEMSKAEA